MKRVYKRVSEEVYHFFIYEINKCPFIFFAGEQYSKDFIKLELIVGFHGVDEELVVGYKKNNKYYVLKDLL